MPTLSNAPPDPSALATAGIEESAKQFPDTESSPPGRLPDNIQVGQLFASFDDLRVAIQQWSIRDKFTFRTPIRDRERADYRCHFRKEGCPWRLYATQKDGVVTVRRIDAQHIGHAATIKPTRSTANTQTWLLREVPRLLPVTKETTPQEIMDAIQLYHGEKVHYQAAHETKQRLVEMAKSSPLPSPCPPSLPHGQSPDSLQSPAIPDSNGSSVPSTIAGPSASPIQSISEPSPSHGRKRSATTTTQEETPPPQRPRRELEFVVSARPVPRVVNMPSAIVPQTRPPIPQSAPRPPPPPPPPPPTQTQTAPSVPPLPVPPNNIYAQFARNADLLEQVNKKLEAQNRQLETQLEAQNHQMLTRLASMENRVEETAAQLETLLHLLTGSAEAETGKSSALLDQMYKKREKEKMHLNKRLTTLENNMNGMASQVSSIASQMNMLLQIFTPPPMPQDSSTGSSGAGPAPVDPRPPRP